MTKSELIAFLNQYDYDAEVLINNEVGDEFRIVQAEWSNGPWLIIDSREECSYTTSTADFCHTHGGGLIDHDTGRCDRSLAKPLCEHGYTDRHIHYEDMEDQVAKRVCEGPVES